MNKEQLTTRYQGQFASKELSFSCRISYDGDLWGREYWKFVCRYDVMNPDEDIEIQISRAPRFYKVLRDSGNFLEQLLIWKHNFENIGHPLTRGRLYQELLVNKYCGMTEIWQFLDPILREKLRKSRLLDKTIYEWVEVPEIYEILLSIKDNYE